MDLILRPGKCFYTSSRDLKHYYHAWKVSVEHARENDYPVPKVIVVEPKNAACAFESAKQNDGHKQDMQRRRCRDKTIIKIDA